MAGEARDGDLVAIEPLRESAPGIPAGARGRDHRLGQVRARGEPHRARDASYSRMSFRPPRSRRPRTRGPCASSRPARGLARAPARHHRSARRQGSRRRRPCRSSIPILGTPAGSSSPSPSPTSRPMSAPGRRWTRKRSSAATRSISPTGSCRCCPSASRTTSARSRAHEDRPALAVRMILGADGRKRSHAFHRIMMRSAAKTLLRAGAGRDRRTDGRDDEAASRQRAEAPLRRPFGRSESSASAATRSISICPSASSFSIPKGASRTSAGPSGSMRIG